MTSKQNWRILVGVFIILSCLAGLSVSQPGTGLQLNTAISNSQWPTGGFNTPPPSAWVTGTPAASGFGSGFYDSANNRVYYAGPFSVGFTNGLTGTVPTILKAWNEAPLNNFMKIDMTAASNNGGFGYAIVVHDVGYQVYDLNTRQVIPLAWATQTITGALQIVDIQVNNFYIMATYLPSGGGTSAHWLSANTGTANSATLTSATRCFIAFYHSGRQTHYWGCAGGFLSNLLTNRPVDGGPGPSTTLTAAGAGNFTSGVLDASADRLYLGSSIGLGISVDLTTNTATDLFFTFGSSALSNLRSVILDKSGELPALFWGTNDGRVVRVNTRDFKTVFSSTSTGAKDLLSVAHSDGTNIWFSRGYTPGTTSGGSNNQYYTWSLTKTNCSAYSCATCLGASNVDREYCGMCVDTGACTTRSACSGNSWTQSGICPSADSVTLSSSGSTSGGTLSQFNGAYFDTSAGAGSYLCSYSDGSRTVNVSIESNSLTTTSVQCRSPSWPSSKTVNVLVYYKNSRVWAGSWQFSYYDCASLGGCSSCSSASSSYPECKWCFAQGSCTSSFTCGTSASPDWTINQCPVVGTLSQTAIASTASNPQTISVPVSNFNAPAGYQYECKYSGSFAIGSGSTVSSGGVITSINCQFNPSSASITGGAVNIAVSIVRSTNNNIVFGTSSSTFEVYNCATFEACIDCTARTTCGWCGGTSQCFSTTGAEPGGCARTTECSQITSLNVTKLTLGTASMAGVAITGLRLDQTTTGTCHWIRSDFSELTTASTWNSVTSVNCRTPGGFAAGVYSLALGTTTKLSTNKFPFSVYDCAARSSCGTCVVPDITDQCTWCVDINNPGCREGSSGVCSTRITDHASPSCPALDFAAPDVFPVTGSANVSLNGDHRLDSSTIADAQCAFRIASSETLTDVSLVNDTQVSCDSVPSSPVTGEAAVQLVSRNGGANYTNSVPITYASCDQFTTCQSCMGSVNSFCVWCGASCNTTCAPSLTHEACPFVDHITPNFSIQAGGDRIAIIGGNFLTTTSKRASTFTCSWDATTNTDAMVDSPTQISCLTPQRSTSTTLPLTIKYLGQPYLTTAGIKFFTCPSTNGDFCFSDCALTEHCGWCVGSKTCSSSYQCDSGNGIWMTGSCVTASLDVSNSPVQGEIPVTATLSQALPIDTLDSEVKCLFGTIEVDATVSTTGNLTLTTTISCTIPAVTAPTVVKYGILYRGNKFVQPVDFKYTDCSLNTGCTACLAADSCGWCSKGNKCTFQSQCASGWTKVKCPINKVGLGVGLGLGLLFLLGLIVLALFLLRRARKRKGLIINLKEPNYDEIAWGNDTTLAWRVPAHNFKILETGLSRKDFLLQLAIAFNCPATEQDALAKAMVYVASAHGLAADLIQTCIRYEVQTCLHENTLFRNNSVASKMYKFFSRIVGIKYLFNCIARVILELEILGRQNANPKKAADGSNEVSLLSMTMELDQTKALGDDIDTDTNLLQLQLICQKLLNVLIKSSVKNIPAPFRKIFIEIDNSVMGRFAGSNDAVYKGIGGLFFLRFVCPAITAPHVYGLLESPPNQTTQRQLVLISKVIQNIANMQPPGKKEEYMTALNDFIVQAIPKIIKFYDNLRLAVNLPQAGESDEQVVEVPDEVRLNGLAAIWNFLHTEKGKLRKWAATPECPFDEQQKVDLDQLLTECETEYPQAPKKLKGGATAELADGGKKKKKSK